jgi:hypothetical protein
MHSYLRAFMLTLVAGAICAPAAGDDRHPGPNVPHPQGSGSSLCAIQGKVVDHQSRRPLPGISVSIERISGSPITRATATTNGSGAYSKVVPRIAETYRVTPLQEGYEFIPASKEVSGACGTADFFGTAAK